MRTVDPSQSSTFEVVVPDGFQIQYLDGSTASGDYVTDHFEIGDTVIESLQMGLANQTASGTGVLGIGFTANEAAEVPYPNLVDQMVAQNFIPTKAYSLYLNDYQSSTGSILFGGVDTEKFIGGLAVIPILPDAQTQNFTSFTVGMTAVSFAFPNGTTHSASLQGGSLDAVLDSGTTLSYFPDDVATPLFDALGAYTYSSLGSVGLTMVECSLATSGLNMTFRFNDSVSIVVPADEIVIDAFGPVNGAIPPEIPLQNPCLFGIQNSGDSLPSEGARQIDFALLGDTFLRSAYVVYDLDRNEIALAQANLNSTDTNVQELTESSDLASFEGVDAQQESSGTSGGGGSSGTGSGSGSGSSASSTGTLFVSSVRAGSVTSGGASATSVDSMTTRDTRVGTVSTEGGVTATATSPSASLSSTVDSRPSSYPSSSASANKTVLSSSSGVQSVSATFTNGVIASSSANAALMGTTSGYGALYTSGLAVLFAISGSTLFWM